MGHSFRNADPARHARGPQLRRALSGVVVVETIFFALDGMGLYFVNALNAL